MNKKEHYAYIDIAKGILIISVVLHHLIIGEYYAGYNNTTVNLLFEFHYYAWLPFVMAAFFFITGLCSNFNKDFKPYITNLCFSIGCPILFFDIIPFNISNYHSQSLSEWIIGIPLSFTRFVRYSYWFLRALFVAKVLYWILYKYCSLNVRYVVCIISSLVAGIAVINGYGEHGCHSIMAMSFIGFGELCKKYKAIYTKYGIQSILLYLLPVSLLYILGRQVPYMANKIYIGDIYDVFLYPFLAVTGAISVIYISYKIYKNKVLEYVGKYSLVIYCLHLLPYPKMLFNHVMGYIVRQDVKLLNSFEIIIYDIVYVVYIISFCLLFSYLMDRPYLRIVLGKRG